MAFTRTQIAHYAGKEICSFLSKATNWSVADTEGMWLSERQEPWLGILGPPRHNTDTRVYYWPEMTV